MSIDNSAVARVLGITTTFKDLRGGAARFLPMRIVVLAQGQTGVSFPTTKYTALSAAAAGTRFGFRSPIYHAMRQLKPASGGGVGTIPITVYPLPDHASGVAAAGDITPSGTATKTSSYRVKISEVLSAKFIIAAGSLATAANLTAACKAIGEAIDSVLHSPMNVAYTYGTVTASALVGTGNGTITVLSAPGAAVPGVWTLKLNTVVANGGVWTLTDPNGTVVSTTITMTPGAATATVINAGGLRFTLTDGSTDFGLNATFTITVPATSVGLVAAWKGPTGDDLKIEIVDDLGDLTFAITQPTGGLNNPEVTAALAQIGNVWETLILNGATIDDTDILDEIQELGEGRWGTTFHRPFLAFTGNTVADPIDATEVIADRPTDRVNLQLVAPGSADLPIVVAAAQLAKLAVVANNTPSRNYTAQRAPGIHPGTDAQQWDNDARDYAVKRGSSTTEVVDGVVQISDVMTGWRPTGEEPPAYRYACDIVKLMNIIFNVQLLFGSDEWAGAALVPDDQAVAEPTAKKPLMARALLAGLVDSLALDAIISDPKGVKKTIFANIDDQNPKRLNLGFTPTISGNAQILDAAVNWGFFFGTPALAA